MRRLTRRRTIAGLGASGMLALAACLDAPDDGEDDDHDDGDDDYDDGDDDHDADDDDPPEPSLTTEVHHVDAWSMGIGWNREERPGICLLIDDPMDASWLLEDVDRETETFVEETDFDSSVLLYVESVGPDGCHDRLEFGEFSREDGAVTGEVTVVDTGEDDEVCTTVLTYPRAFVRVTADPLPDRARLTLTDGRGERATVDSADGLIDPASLEGHVRPESDPEPRSGTLDCPEGGVERHYRGYDPDDVSWGSGAAIEGPSGLELRVVNPDAEPAASPDEALRLERGDEFRVELTNVAGAPIGTGNHGKYNLEAYTEAGWEDVRVFDADRPIPYTDELLLHRPGETVVWEFVMTEDGLVEDGPHADSLRVCPDLEPGRHRFVFWGADALAVAFEYVG